MFGQLTDDLATTARYSGYMKFVGCVCAATSWKLGAFHTAIMWDSVAPNRACHVSGVIESFTQIVVNLVFFVVCVPFTYVVASELPEKADSSFTSSYASLSAGANSELTMSLQGTTPSVHGSTPGYGRLN